MVVDCARDKNIPIRIGVNAGSLEKDLQEKYGEPTPQALLESAMRHVDHLDRLNFDQFKVSVKPPMSSAVESYRLLAKEIDQPLHLGITEAGGLRSGSVKSAIGRVCCSRKGSATPCAFRWRPIRSKRSKLASTF